MDSDIAMNNFLSGSELMVQIEEIHDGIFIVMNTDHAMKGFLMHITKKNNVIFDKLISECKELNMNYDKEKRHSSFCIPDSTLSQNAVESNSDHNEEMCSNCKSPLNKVPKINNRSPMSRELARLTKHGFNEDLLKKKNDLSRRGTIKGYLQKPKVKVKSETNPRNKNVNVFNKVVMKDDDANISRPKGLKKFNSRRDSLLSIRHTTARTLKTRANERIIDLCRNRKSFNLPYVIPLVSEAKEKMITPGKKRKHLMQPVVIPVVKEANKKIIKRGRKRKYLEPSSVILPVIETNEKNTKMVRKRKSLKSSNKILAVNEEVNKESLIVDVPVEKKQKLSTPRMSDTSVYDFVDDDCESEPIKPIQAKVRRRRRLKSEMISILPKQTSDDVDVQSNPAVTSYEHNGSKFSINDVVWAKIPGYPFWPARITSFDNDHLPKSYGKRCRINWIGWHQTSYLPLKSLLHFKEHFAVKYSSKLKSRKYKHAIELACEELNLNLADLLPEFDKLSPSRNSGSAASLSKKKLINLDEIFSGNVNTRNVSKIDIDRKSCSEDDDTDEEEKARSALITAESLEANTKLSGLISRVD